MTNEKPAAEKIFGVALFGMPYLYQSRDFDFHMEMIELGLRRGGPLLSGLQHKAILTNSHEYWLADCDDENEFCCKFGFVPTIVSKILCVKLKRGKGMKSEKARAFLDRKSPKREHPVSGKETYGLLSKYDAERAIELVEEEAEEALQELREKFAADIKRLVDKWDISDRKIDQMWNKEAEAYKADIEKYKREISELKQRLAIADKIIADKNKESRKQSP